MLHGSVSHGVDCGAKKRSLSETSEEGEVHVAKKMEGERVTLIVRRLRLLKFGLLR